jgi:hypothetical protein
MQFNLADVEERLNQLVEEAVKDKKQVKQLYDQLFDHKLMELLHTKMIVEEISGDFNQFIAFMTGETHSESGKGEEVKGRKGVEKKEEGADEEVKPKKTRRSPAKKKEVSSEKD